MTLIEFLAAYPRKTWLERVMAVLYWSAHYRDEPELTAAQIRTSLQQARVKGAKDLSVPSILARSGHLVDVVGKSPEGHNVWRLTQTGVTAVRDALGVPDGQPRAELGVAEMKRVSAKLTDSQVRGYVDEAILCLNVGALRAAIVFMWVGAAQVLRDRVWSHGDAAVNRALKSHNPKAPMLAKADDLAEVREATLLQVAQDLGVIDKSQKQTLAGCLTLRNQCGHPGKYNPGENRAKAHIEDIVGVLFN